MTKFVLTGQRTQYYFFYVAQKYELRLWDLTKSCDYFF